jgi:aryl-alcohol dehydrogenase-like predicted oxidoreductase
LIDTNLSLGCHNLTGGSSYLRSARLVHCALDLGIRRFDTAPSYGFGTAEATLARALGKRRLDPAIEITTKYGLLPPRFGRIAAWMREPYRMFRSANKTMSTPMSVQPLTLGSVRCICDARGALESSLRAMKLDRIGTYLSHERLDDRLADRFSDDMATLLQLGLIEKAGCSGEISNVIYMLGKANCMARVGQVSIRHCDVVTGVDELRLFNLGAVARELLKVNHAGAALTNGLRDALPGRADLDATGLALAAVLADARYRLPSAVFIVNASSAKRLASMVEASVQPNLVRWTQENPLVNSVPHD